MISVPITSWQIEGGKVEVMTDFTFLGSGKSLQTVTAATKLKDACSLEKKSYDQPTQHINEVETLLCQQSSV